MYVKGKTPNNDLLQIIFIVFALFYIIQIHCKNEYGKMKQWTPLWEPHSFINNSGELLCNLIMFQIMEKYFLHLLVLSMI